MPDRQDEITKLRDSLITAYEIIQQQTKLICDFNTLIMPLMKAVVNEEEYEGLSLGEAYAQCSAELADESARLEQETLAAVESAIRRLKEN
jgi:hypothetical protein